MLPVALLLVLMTALPLAGLAGDAAPAATQSAAPAPSAPPSPRAAPPSSAPSSSAQASSAAPPAAPARRTKAQDEALERRLAEAVRRNPDSFEAHHTLAELYLHQGRLAVAIPLLQRAQAIDPTHYANGYDLAVALLEIGKPDEARQQVQRMLAAKDSGELQNLLGDVEERAGNLMGAAEAYQRAANLEPSEEHLFDWGNNLLQLRAYEPATQVFEAGLKRHPTSARLHVGLGIARYSRGQYNDAVEAFCRAVDLAPSDPRPYQFLGEMYGVSPELAGAITERLARFVRARPRDALAHYYYAMNLWKGQGAAAPSEDVARIEALLRKAVTLDPKLAQASLQLGILLFDQRRFPESIVELRRATRLEPDLTQAHYRLAQAYQRTGQKALAAKALAAYEQLKAREDASASTPQPPR